MRARMALRYAGVQVQLREVVLRDKPAALLAISAKATVPVLQLNCGESSGKVIEESVDIMRWALAQHDPALWLENSAVSDALIAQNDGEFKPLLDHYKYANRHPERTPAEHRQRGVDALLTPLNERLKTQAYLLGAQLRLADVALFPFVRQFAAVDAAWFAAAPLMELRQWLLALEAAELFQSVMQKLPAWRAGDAATRLF